MIVSAVVLRFNWRMSKVSHGFEVTRCLDAIAAIESELKELAATLTEAQFQAPPRAGGWSVGYCIEHLVLTGNGYLGKWDAALKDARTTGGATSFPYHWWQRAALRFIEPPYRLRIKTSQSFVPYSRRSMRESIDRFLSMHQAFAGRVRNCGAVDVHKTAVQSPFVSWIWYPLGFSFDLALAHERRHLWQARQVKQKLLEQL